MSRYLILMLSLLYTGTLMSQDFVTLDYKWNEDPLSITCPDSLKSESEVSLKQNIIIEFGYLGEDFIERDLYHSINYLGSDEAIENNNRIYLPIANDETLEVSMARSISPDGKVIELTEEDINTAEDEEGNITHYYAFKGLEKGSIVEYYYVQINPANYRGQRIIFQDEMTQLDVNFDLISPWNLVFGYIGLNGFGEMEVDTSDSNVNHLSKHFDVIEKYEFESRSYFGINAMQMIYKLDENLANGKRDVISYSEIADYLISEYTVGDKSDNKIVAKWLKESGVKSKSTDLDKMRAYEFYLKSNFAIIDNSADELKDLSFVAENKITSPTGFIKAIAIASNELDIEYEIVITCDRSEMLFDENFEAFNYIEKYLIYFPGMDSYIDPLDKFGCIGLVSPYYQDTYGAFIKKVSLGDYVSGISQVKFIEGTKADESHHDMIMDVKMSDDFSSLEVDLSTVSTGYFAKGVQPYYDILEPDDIETTNEDQVTWIADGIEVNEVEVVNPGHDNLGINPFLLNSSFTANEFVSQAREKYLIKIGLLIGPQEEMYQETKRRLPVDSDFRKVYHREINFEIPEGYSVSNLEAIDINNEASDENGVYASFKSSYKMDGNTLKIVCDERYDKIHYELEEYEDFRNIINSAADFNKIVLILEENN